MVSNAERYQLSRRSTWVGAATNCSLAVVKLVVGFVGRSPALFADGLHSFSDLLCDGLVLVAAYYGHEDADANHPYGHRRFETIATFTLGVFLLLLGLAICLDGVEQIAHHTAERPDYLTLVVAVLSVVANESLFRYQLQVATQVDSDLLRANAWHSRGDALASIIVLVGIAGAMAGWPLLDPLAAVFVGAIIVRMGVRWGWRALYELSDAGVDPEELRLMEALIKDTGGVLHMHQLRTRRMADKIVLDVHIEIEPYLSASEGHYIAECVRVGLMRTFPSVGDVTVHVDVENHPEGLPKRMPKSRAEVMAAVQAILQQWLPEAVLDHLVIHYVAGKMELELYWQTLPDSVNGSQVVEPLRRELLQIEGVRQVRFWSEVAEQ